MWDISAWLATTYTLHTVSVCDTSHCTVALPAGIAEGHPQASFVYVRGVCWSRVPEVCGNIRFIPLSPVARVCTQEVRFLLLRLYSDQDTRSWSDSEPRTDPRLAVRAKTLSYTVLGGRNLSSDDSPHRDSNPRPFVYKSDALPTELRRSVTFELRPFMHLHRVIFQHGSYPR